MIERAVGQQGQRLLHREQQPLDVDVERPVEVLLGDLPERRELAAARVGEEDVDAALLLLDHRVEPVEIREVGDVALDAGGPRADQLHRRVELGLPAAGDEDVSALGGEPLRGGEPDPAGAAGDDRDLPVQFAHGPGSSRSTSRHSMDVRARQGDSIDSPAMRADTSPRRRRASRVSDGVRQSLPSPCLRTGSSSGSFASWKRASGPDAPCVAVSRSTRGRYLDALLYEQVNDLDLRTRLYGSWGFCNWHAWMLRETSSPAFGSSIICDDLLRLAGRRLERTSLRRILGPRGLLGRLLRRFGRRRPPALVELYRRRSTCPACGETADSEARYLQAALAFVDDAQFDDAYEQSQGLCVPHVIRALELGAGSAQAARSSRARFRSGRICDATWRDSSPSTSTATGNGSPRPRARRICGPSRHSWARPVSSVTRSMPATVPPTRGAVGSSPVSGTEIARLQAELAAARSTGGR